MPRLSMPVRRGKSGRGREENTEKKKKKKKNERSKNNSSSSQRMEPHVGCVVVCVACFGDGFGPHWKCEVQWLIPVEYPHLCQGRGVIGD